MGSVSTTHPVSQSLTTTHGSPTWVPTRCWRVGPFRELRSGCARRPAVLIRSTGPSGLPLRRGGRARGPVGRPPSTTAAALPSLPAACCLSDWPALGTKQRRRAHPRRRLDGLLPRELKESVQDRGGGRNTHPRHKPPSLPRARPCRRRLGHSFPGL